MVYVPAICLLACLLITAIAAVSDARTGHIPNWLTLPPLAVAPLAWWLYGGLWRTDAGSLGGCVLSIALCSLVPWIFFQKKALGAGDVKLFACVGALALVNVGIEAEFYAFCAGSLFALARLAWDGKLLRTLGNVLVLLVNPVLPRARRRTIAPELMTRMRFGTAIFVGTLVAALSQPPIHRLLP